MKVTPFSLLPQLSEIGSELDSAVSRVLLSGNYIGGVEVQTFEKSFAASLGVNFAVGCNSGTDALILALRALGIGPGDEVITSSFSFFATAEAISNVGARPVFVDVDPTSYLINLELVEKAITASTKAILPVHLFGCPLDMDSLMALAVKHRLKVVEDCAQAAGAQWNGRPVGSWGDIGCFSFFPTKNLGGAGDGGAVTTNDAELAQIMRELSIHGMPRRYTHTQLGYNSRLDSIQAAILNVKLPRLFEWVKKRQEIASRYQQYLQHIPGLELPSDQMQSVMTHAWNQFVVRVNKLPINSRLCKDEVNSTETINGNLLHPSVSRDWLKSRLEDEGVQTIIYYPIPIHLQPAYKDLGYSEVNLPVTEILCNEVLSLPIYPELTIEQQEHVVNSIERILD